MPPEQSVWLHDEERSFPCPSRPCQKDVEHAIRFRAYWPLHLPFEHDELVSQQGVFCHQLGLASAKIGHGLEWQGRSERFGPTSQARGERIQATLQEAQERGHNTSHNKIFSVNKSVSSFEHESADDDFGLYTHPPVCAS